MERPGTSFRTTDTVAGSSFRCSASAFSVTCPAGGPAPFLVLFIPAAYLQVPANQYDFLLRPVPQRRTRHLMASLQPRRLRGNRVQRLVRQDIQCSPIRAAKDQIGGPLRHINPPPQLSIRAVNQNLSCRDVDVSIRVLGHALAPPLRKQI